jgi:predicted kinase
MGTGRVGVTESQDQGKPIDAERLAHRACLILVNGFPGTGKTTVGKQLSEQLHVPFLSKDAIKERIFDALGCSDKQWSLKVSGASHRILDYIIEEELQAGHSMIVESNFKPDPDGERFRRFQTQYGVPVIQILCWAEGDVLWERYRTREATNRHPGHVESAGLEEQRQRLLPGKCEALPIDGPTIEVDTTDFGDIDYRGIVRAINDARAAVE